MEHKTVLITNVHELCRLFPERDSSVVEVLLGLQAEVDYHGVGQVILIPHKEKQRCLFHFSHENILGIHYTFINMLA
ncbi:hypothetical protein ACFSKU_20690 [Pontibacter silvestris]|uniref:Uncharacterized protein n=1 Tax=Pontibacter silvestris TaxID=2305183 RepID=A0ABW4X5L5_9BACT|nr:hypothetical protein [Pontibacter silvestris]MCC9137123.1 hypothetical protein [Pontibacter silvestris]